jgi:hypothetical protein
MRITKNNKLKDSRDSKQCLTKSLSAREEHCNPFIHGHTNSHTKTRHSLCIANEKPPSIVIINVKKRSSKSREAPYLDERNESWLRSTSYDSCEHLSNVSLKKDSWYHEANETQDADDKEIEHISESGPHLLSWEELIPS